MIRPLVAERQVEYRLDAKMTDLGGDVKDLKRDFKLHVKEHEGINSELKEHGQKIATYDAMIPKLEQSVEKLGEVVDRFAISIALLDEQTKNNTDTRKSNSSYAKEIFIGFLILLLGYLLNGGGN